MAEKKKGGLINRLIMGSEKSEGYARASLPSNRWELFWDILKGRFSKLVIINLLVLVFFIPLFILLFLMSVSTSYFGSINSFSQNIGVGYPALPSIAGMAESIDLSVNVQMYLFLPICLIVAALGVSGGAYVIRNMVWTEGIFVSNDFWKGIKQNFFVVMLALLFFSAVFYFAQWSVGLSNYMIAVGTGNTVLLNIAKAMIIITLCFVTIMVAFMITMGVTYDLKFGKLIKNSFIMTVALLPTNVFFLAIGLLPFILMIVFGVTSMLGIILMFLVILLAFSWCLLVWTDYSHWIFDKFVNDKVPGAKKNRGIYEKISENDAAALQQYREQVAMYGRSQLTRRPIKPITDDELQLMELPQSFSRKDLQKLQESKDAIRRDAEEYYEAHKNEEQYQLTEEEKKIEEEREQRKIEARMALEGKKVPKKKKDKKDKKGKK